MMIIQMEIFSDLQILASIEILFRADLGLAFNSLFKIFVSIKPLAKVSARDQLNYISLDTG